MELNYSDLVLSYEEALHNTLRNFKPVPDFLDTWVPDENLSTSILGIVEAAGESNVAVVSVAMSRDQLKKLDCDYLRKETHKLGCLAIDENGKMIFQFKKGGELVVGDLYKKSLTELGSRVVFEGRFDRAEASQIMIVAQHETSSGEVRLTCLVNKEHRIVGAKHEGAQGTLRIVLDQLCAEITGLPIQEASEHGVLRLEYRLRDKDQSRSVKGILTPKNTDPIFAVPLELIREIFSKYRSEINYEFKRNFYVDAVHASFDQLSKSEKIQSVQTKLREICVSLGLDTNVEVVDWKPDARAVLSFKEQPGSQSLGPALLKIERILQEKLEPRIELVLESVEDTNKRVQRTKRSTGTSETTVELTT